MGILKSIGTKAKSLFSWGKENQDATLGAGIVGAVATVFGVNPEYIQKAGSAVSWLGEFMQSVGQ